ncbi:zf-HC2 domain-containing protein [Isoptericola sp. NEAU-Y5]|uniref:Zf-HC2 domain-containing protein n=1 Tax=Isoptericola luteus TaxID=2879484 RepID=A0ABS7ZBI0_9MICO|nr:zf-HC2 domain-containing protein [Isoptericola sp. NEAU-Y5]MCA5892380.1 zf-HC2 domain-containing protein [Isoptericola sp. NEAU-Y5]
MTGHLGCWVSDLADGQLDAASAERAFEHVAGCARCADELEAARAARRALAAARDVAPDPGLTERLLALSASIPPAAGDPLRGSGRADRWDSPHTWEPLLTGDLSGRRRRQRLRRVSMVGAGGVGVLGLLLVALGQGPVVTPDPSRSAALTLLASVGPGAMSGDDALVWLDANGWAAPTRLPEGYEITAVHVVTTSGTTPEVEVDLSGPDGAVVVRQRPGRLSGDARATLPVPGHDVQVLSSDPWHVAWQAGETAVELTADAPRDEVAALVASFPGGGYDAGVLPQLSRGWSTVTGALLQP